jgi:DNA-binding CsgD family transcriptional regulator
MVPFSVALIFDLAAAVVLTVSVARLFRGHGSPTLLSYLFYLVSWYTLVLYMLVFLFAPRFLPESAQHGYMMFNSIFVVPLNGCVAFFFADFIWRWLKKPMPRLLRFGLPISFLAILVVYAREMLGRLSAESQPEPFVLSAPASLGLMFACLLFVSLYAVIAGHGLKDRKTGRHVLLFGAVTGGGTIIGLLFIFGVFSFLGLDWQNAVSSMILASVTIGGWVFARGFFRGQAHAVAAQLASADLSVLEARYGISPREREIISLTITGKSNREITEALYISHETVKKHIYNAYRKIGVKNRVQLVNAVLESSASLPTESN